MDGHRRALDRRILAPIAAAAVPAGFLVVFFAYPFATVVARGLTANGSFDLPTGTLWSKETLEIAWFTVWQALLSTVLTLIAALPLAWVIGRFSFPGRGLVRAAVLVPFVLPTLVVASAFLAVLPARFDHTVGAILLAHVFFNVAVVVRIVGGYWSQLDRTLLDAAATLGAGPIQRLRHVMLPLLTPAIGAAAALVFLFCFTSFGVIVVLGGLRYATLETEIYNQAARLFDLRAAATLSLLQLLAITALLVVTSLLERKVARRTRQVAEADALRRPQGRERLAVAAVLALSGVGLGLPVAALVDHSLSTPSGTGLDNFQALGRETTALLVPPWVTALNSLVFALTATAIALSMGSLLAFSLARLRPGWLDALVLLPLGTSAVLLGFGFAITFDEPPLELRSSIWLVPIVQSLVATPFVVRIVAPAVRAIDVRLREAASVLGAAPHRVWREIDLPLVSRSIGVAAGFAFAVSLGEFGATIFVAQSEHPTLPVAIFRFLGRPGAENQGLAAALAVMLAGLTVVVTLAAERIGGGRQRVL